MATCACQIIDLNVDEQGKGRLINRRLNSSIPQRDVFPDKVYIIVYPLGTYVNSTSIPCWLNVIWLKRRGHDVDSAIVCPVGNDYRGQCDSPLKWEMYVQYVFSTHQWSNVVLIQPVTLFSICVKDVLWITNIQYVWHDIHAVNPSTQNCTVSTMRESKAQRNVLFKDTLNDTSACNKSAGSVLCISFILMIN